MCKICYAGRLNILFVLNIVDPCVEKYKKKRRRRQNSWFYPLNTLESSIFSTNPPIFMNGKFTIDVQFVLAVRLQFVVIIIKLSYGNYIGNFSQETI